MAGKVQIFALGGAQALEGALLSAIDGMEREEAATGAGARTLNRPIRVVVPSHSLRLHLNAVLVAPPRSARLGVRVQTLADLANEILELERVGPRAELFFDFLIRQALRETPNRAGAFRKRADLVGLLAPSVADLLDAGLDSESLAACLAAVSQEPRDPGAADLLQLADRVSELFREHQLSRTGDQLAAASQVLRAGSPSLRARRVFVYGFAEATGRASDLIQALVEHSDAEVWIQRPPNPTAPATEDPGSRFSDRLIERLATAEQTQIRCEAATHQIETRAATDLDTEIRNVAESVARLLEAGTRDPRRRAESIGVVARNLEPVALPIARHFERRGIPFSALKPNPVPTAAARQVQKLIQLLSEGSRTPVSLWLEIGQTGLPSSERRDLAAACHALGCGRLEALAALEPSERLGDQKTLGLPIRRGFSRVGADAERVVALRRSITLEALQEITEQAEKIVLALQGLPDRSGVEAFCGATAELVASVLKWPAQAGARVLLGATLETLRAQAPSGLEVDLEDFLTLLQESVQNASTRPLGGRGAGVQVLDVTEARGRSFDHLFVVGLNRDVFPRNFSEDPLFSDTSRARLGSVLPELPLKLEASDEESYLFAQIVASSPRVQLSWHQRGDDGRPRTRSPLIDRLIAADANLEPSQMLPVSSRSFAGRRSAREAAVSAGLAGNQAVFLETLQAAIAIRRPDAAGLLTKTRAKIRAEYEPTPNQPPLLSPYLGLIGAQGAGRDPREAPLFITTIENYLACPWQTFLTRYLRIEGTPDALDALPSLRDPALIGTTVHRALEVILSRELEDPPTSLASASDAEGQPLRWPEPGQVDAALLEVAFGALLDSGVESKGMARALSLVARPYVERAQELLLREDTRLIGTELEGRVDTPLGRVEFRADLVERAAGRLRLSDFKTSKSIASLATQEKRELRLLAELRAGRALQAGVYAVSSGEGRYVFLRPDIRDDHAIVGTHADREGLRENLDHALRLGQGGLAEGVFFPRLENPDGKEPARCSWCDVAEACLRSDSGSRTRLAKLAQPGDRELRDGEVRSGEGFLGPLWNIGGGA